MHARVFTHTCIRINVSLSGYAISAIDDSKGGDAIKSVSMSYDVTGTFSNSHSGHVYENTDVTDVTDEYLTTSL